MRPLVPILATALAATLLGGCAKKFRDGECETSDNCKDQAGYGKICVQGHCQECGADSDCKAGFACKANKCEPRPECESSADCAAGKACEAGKCVAAAPECSGDRPCPGGQHCMEGKCMAASVPASGPCDELGSVYFDFDRSSLRDESRTTLDQAARCIAQKAPESVRVEGNCDERGTAEYNMHLGQRRADAVRKYLVDLGVAAKKVKTVSYGKERPVCGEHEEACWQKNRRADVKQ